MFTIPRGISSFLRLCPLALASLLVPFGAHSQTPEVLYRWDAAKWMETYNKNQFIAEPITNADGTVGAKIVATPRSGNNPYNHIIATSAGGMNGGEEYTACITFSVAEPTKFPCAFFMFARNTAGNQYDIWQRWIGLPGAVRTVSLPLDLPVVDGGKWTLNMGIEKAGGLNIQSIVVYKGSTADGTKSFVNLPPTGPSVGKSVKVTPATGYTPFDVTPPKTTAVISMADYKFKPEGPDASEAVSVENAAEFQRAIKDCKGKGGARLVIPKGVYHLAPVNSINFTGSEDLIVDGQGSTLVFESFTKDGPAISASGVSRVVFQDFNIDWNTTLHPIASIAIPSNLSPDKLQADITFPDLNSEQLAGVQKADWRSMSGMETKNFMHTETPSVTPGKKLVFAPGSAPNSLRVTFPAPVKLEEGSTYCIRHLYYEEAGFKVSGSTDVSFQRVNIYAIPGMAFFFGGGMRNFELLKCNIVRAPGSRAPLTSAADGIHVDQFIENLKIEGCYITGTGDDTMNIHNESYQGEIVLDPSNPRKMTLLNCPSWQLRIVKDDPMEIYNGDYSSMNKSLPTATRIVESVSSDNKAKPQTTTIEFTEPIPAGVTPVSILINGRLKTSNLLISGCTMEHSGGRGILLSAQNATVEKNYFHDVRGSGINLESEIVQPLWTEGRGARNVLIKNNVFEDIVGMIRYNFATVVTNTRIPWGPTTADLYGQITVENNQFINPRGPTLSLRNVNGLLVRGNEFKTIKSGTGENRYAGAISLNLISGASIVGNKWIGAPSGGSAPAVTYDPSTTSDLNISLSATGK